MIISLVSCEPTTLGKKNVLINLAELGNEMQSLSHMEQMLQQKGFVKIHEEVEETEEYVDGLFVYTNNIQLDSTLVTAADKIRLQTENATILTVQFYSEECNHLEAMLYACYILPEETTESYKIISNNLYHYYSDKFSYTLYENTDDLSQEYSWYGFIDEKEYNNKDEHYTYIFNKGAISKTLILSIRFIWILILVWILMVIAWLILLVLIILRLSVDNLDSEQAWC